MTLQQTWTLDARRRPVVLAGGSQLVRDLVARSCAAAGVAPVFVPTLEEGLGLNPVVLLTGPEQAAGRSAGQREVIVVGMADDEATVWGVATNLPSSRVVVLPQGSGWLAEYLGRRLSPAATGSVVAFIGSGGGCGVSTFAYWCARQSAGAGTSVLLVDGHPMNGGLDLALGIEDRPGVRWHDLTDIRGSLNPDQLASALPTEGRLSVLSHSARAEAPRAGPGDMAASRAVVDAARGAFDVTVIDLGSADSAIRSLAAACDHVVLVIPSKPRGVGAAAAILREYGSVPSTVVLRGPVLEGLDAWLVADLVGRPGPLPYLPFVRGAAQAEAGGRMPGFPLPRQARKVVRSVAAVMEGSG